MEEPKKYKILITDDDTFLLDMYSLKFTQLGFIVDTANGGEMALDKLTKGGDYDVMLVDLMMPGMDGFHLLERINIDKLALHAKKIVLSNLGSEDDLKRCNILGVDGYIVKANSTPNEVVEEVNRLLAHHK